MESLLNLFKKSEIKDTGLRGTIGGRLYVDKTVFYKRPEVRKTINDLMESSVIREQIQASKG